MPGDLDIQHILVLVGRDLVCTRCGLRCVNKPRCFKVSCRPYFPGEPAGRIVPVTNEKQSASETKTTYGPGPMPPHRIRCGGRGAYDLTPSVFL